MRKNKFNKKQNSDRTTQILNNQIVKYFESEDLSLSENWRDTKLRYNIYKVFDKLYWKRDGEFDMNVAITELQTILPSMKKLLNTIQTPEGDGIPYGEDNDSGNLSYVSDRWFCQFRLVWLIQLVERNWLYQQVGDDWVRIEKPHSFETGMVWIDETELN